MYVVARYLPVFFSLDCAPGWEAFTQALCGGVLIMPGTLLCWACVLGFLTRMHFADAQAASSACFSHGFENGGGQWSATKKSPYGWSRAGVSEWRLRYGRTPSWYTGPSGASENLFYVYFEASSGFSFDEATLISPMLSGATQVSFYYHMFGAGTGKLEASWTVTPP